MKVIVSILVVVTAMAVPGLAAPAKHGAFGSSPDQPKRYPAPPLRAAAAPVVAKVVLPTASRSLAASREDHAGPERIGTVQEIAGTPLVADSGERLEASGASRWRWHGSVTARGATRLRLRIAPVSLSDDAVLWVYGEEGEAVGFDLALRDASGALWTPSVAGDAITLEIDAKRGGAVRLMAVAAIEDAHAEGTECLRDVACQSTTVLESASAVAQYEFVRGNAVFVCSGGLIIDENETFAPYFLTANHCVSAPSEASSLEAFWDYRASTCGGIAPTLTSRPRSVGATVLATSAAFDTTLLRLSSVPGTRFWMGWDPDHQPAGRILRRVSHPSGGPQVYSETSITTTSGACTSLPRGPFLYSVQTFGGTAGGSSGAPAFYGDEAVIVGQLYGSCGSNTDDACDARNDAVDGALEQSITLLQPFLAPTGASPQPCVPSSTQICLNNNRFAVKIAWRSASASGQGQAIKYTADSGLFWFFGSDNIEVLLKVLDGCALSNSYWVFSAATTDVEYTITVTDTKSGKVKTYFHALGSPAPAITDTGAFATCP